MSSPQMMMFDGVGRHNNDIAATRARILEGGTWKKQRTIFLMPAGKTMDTKVAFSMRALIFPPNQPMIPILALGDEVGVAYSNAIEGIISNPDIGSWEYLITMEHDNLPPPDGVVKLIARAERHPEFSCISGLYHTKGEGGVPQIWGDPRDPVLNFRPQPPIPGELVECVGTGMGFALWRIEMFKDMRIERPLFKTYNGTEGKGVGTQDLVFWQKARNLGYRCAVDCSVLVGHLDVNTGEVW